MAKSLKIPWGLRAATGTMVHVDDVPNGNACGCVCPSCGAALQARNGGTKIAHHFAHVPDVDRPGACEGWLHGTGKHLLFQRIQTALNEGKPVPLNWQCGECACKHEGNLLKRSNSVHMEMAIETAHIRPDICLAWNGVPTTLLEVVDTHPPDCAVHQFCKKNKLPLLIVNVVDPADLDRAILAPVLEPETHYVDGCRCPLCAHCGMVRICADAHRYCDSCETCVEDQRGQFGGLGDHVHCIDCNEVIEHPRHYSRHYCCYVAKRYGLPVCRDRDDWLHRHCNQCGKRITGKNGWGDFWETCWNCHQKGSETPV